MRAVLDANVFISAVIRPHGPPGLIVTRFQSAAAFELVLTPAIIEEVVRALAYPKIRKLILGDIEPEVWVDDIVLLADLVAGTDPLPRVCVDPGDDKYIAAALEGRADFVVTGDRALLALGEYQGVRILSPRAFLSVLEV